MFWPPYTWLFQIKAVTVQFPDPHFKTRHKKRRVVNPDLVNSLAKHLAEGTLVFLQSDVQELEVDMISHFQNVCMSTIDLLIKLLYIQQTFFAFRVTSISHLRKGLTWPRWKATLTHSARRRKERSQPARRSCPCIGCSSVEMLLRTEEALRNKNGVFSFLG